MKEHGDVYPKQRTMKQKTSDGKAVASDQRNGKFSTMRIIIGVFLSILFILKDLTRVIAFGIARLLSESIRRLIRIIVGLAEEITVTFIRVILRSVEEFLNVVIGIILQVADSGSQLVVRRLRHIVSLLGYLVVVVGFAVAYVVHRIISFFFSEREVKRDF